MADTADTPTEKLKQYEEQLQAVEAAIAQDPTNDEWTKLKADLLEVIRLTQQLSEVKGEVAATSASAASTAAEGAAAAAAAASLQSYAVGDKCQALYEMDEQWYNAKVVALVEDGYFVSYLGYGNTAQVDFNEVRPYTRPDTSTWRSGTEVTAISPADARWYPAKIVSVAANAAKVRFAGQTESVEVELDCVKLPAAAAAAASSTAAKEDKKEEPHKLPKGMEVRPDDSEEEVARKKRKLKMFNRQEKRAKEEQAVDDRRNSWQKFAGKNKTIKKAKNGHDPNWDPTRDHSELAARVAIDKFNNFAAREHR